MTRREIDAAEHDDVTREGLETVLKQVLDAPAHQIAEIIDGTLHTHS